MNDSLVSQLSTASVFSKQAYILFYSRVNPAIPVPPTNAIALPQSQQKIIGQPILSKETINNATSSENEAKIVSLSKSSKIDIKSDAEDVGEVIKPKGDQRKNPLPISSQPQTNSVAATISTTADILPAQREKLDSLHRLLPVSAFKRLKNRNGYVLYAPLR